MALRLGVPSASRTVLSSSRSIVGLGARRCFPHGIPNAPWRGASSQTVGESRTEMNGSAVAVVPAGLSRSREEIRTESWERP
jgi:hypothetical protein